MQRQSILFNSMLPVSYTHLTSLMELELDFSDHEELEFANRDELSSLATHIEQVIARLAHSCLLYTSRCV